MAESVSDVIFEDENTSTLELKNPQNLSWIFSQRGQTFFRNVLDTVGRPGSKTVEASAARAIFSHMIDSIDVADEFLKEVSCCFQVCYQNIEDIKCLNKKMVNLERSFGTLRDNVSLRNKWSLLLNSCGLCISQFQLCPCPARATLGTLTHEKVPGVGLLSMS